MRGSRKFCQRESKFDNVFPPLLLVYEGRDDPNTTLSGPPSARQRNFFLQFCLCVDDDSTLNAGLVAL